MIHRNVSISNIVPGFLYVLNATISAINKHNPDTERFILCWGVVIKQEIIRSVVHLYRFGFPYLYNCILMNSFLFHSYPFIDILKPQNIIIELYFER